MKIVHIDTALTWRGGQNQLYLLLRYLHSCENVQQVVFTPCKSALTEKIKEKDLQIKIENFSNSWQVVSRGSKYAGSRTIFHCHSSKAHTLALLSKKLYRWRSPLLIHRRVDFIPGKWLLNRWKYTSSLVDGYIAISENIKNILVKGEVSPSKVQVVYSGVDFSLLDKSEPVDLSSLMLQKSGSPVFVNVGALTDHKGQIYLLRAARILKQQGLSFRVLICGEGELEPRFEQFIEKYNLHDTVILAGFHSNIAGILKSADYFVMSSHLEGLGTSVIDALYLKKPAIVTKAGGIPEIVRQGRLALCVPPRDSRALAEAMKELLQSDDNKLSEKAFLAHEEVKKRFDYRIMGESVRNTYDTYLSKEGEI